MEYRIVTKEVKSDKVISKVKFGAASLGEIKSWMKMINTRPKTNLTSYAEQCMDEGKYHAVEQKDNSGSISTINV